MVADLGIEAATWGTVSATWGTNWLNKMRDMI